MEELLYVIDMVRFIALKGCWLFMHLGILMVLLDDSCRFDVPSW